MNNFTVACGNDGIYAGIMKPTRDDGAKQWKRKTECTHDAVVAVRDWMLNKAMEEGTSTYSYQWEGRGMEVSLKVEVLKDVSC